MPDGYSFENGNYEGISLCGSNSNSNTEFIHFNFFFKFSLKCDNIEFCPKLIFSVFGLDFLFRNKIIGYGVTNLPLF